MATARRAPRERSERTERAERDPRAGRGDWVDRVWPSPNSLPLKRPRAGKEVVVPAPEVRLEPGVRPGPRPVEAPPADETPEPQPRPVEAPPVQSRQAPLRDKVLQFGGRTRHQPAEGTSRQLSLLDWARPASARRGNTAAPRAALLPWWRRTNWALIFSVLTLGLAAFLIVPPLMESARDGFTMLTGAPAPEAPAAEAPAAPAGEAPAPVEAPPAAPAVAPDAPPGLAAAPAASDDALLFGALHADLALASRGVVVMSGEKELYAWNGDRARGVGGLTKLMAAMVYLDTQPDPSLVLKLDAADARFGGPSARLAVGWSFYARDLLVACLTGSENRAVEALIRATGLSRDEFLVRMQEKGQLLGLQTAAFYDPTGLDPRNVASARDVALILDAAAGYPEITRLTLSPEEAITAVGRPDVFKFKNGTPLLSEDDLTPLIAKSSFTDEAGVTLALKVKTPDLGTLSLVFLGAPAKTDVVRDVERTLAHLRSKVAPRAAAAATP